MITYSTFQNTFDRTPRMATTTWDDFILYLEHNFCIQRPACDAEKSKRTPLMSPALYNPGFKRLNANVVGWGGFVGLDIDNCLTFDETIELGQWFNTDWVAYTTTRSTPLHHKQRLFLRVDRTIEVNEIALVWTALHHITHGVIDRQCKDFSRMYYVPADWEPHPENPEPYVNFNYGSGDGLTVEWLIKQVPFTANVNTSAPTAYTPLSSLNGTAPRLVNGSLFTCPYVKAWMIERYIKTPKGEHHIALYKFMEHIAKYAAKDNYPITDVELATYAAYMDDYSIIKTNPNRWTSGRILNEARRAIGVAAQGVTP